MFRALCTQRQEVKIVLYSIWYRHTCRWPSGVQVERGLVLVALGWVCTVRPLPTVTALWQWPVTHWICLTWQMFCCG